MRDIMASYLSVCVCVRKGPSLFVDWLLLKFELLLSYINLVDSD